MPQLIYLQRVNWLLNQRVNWQNIARFWDALTSEQHGRDSSYVQNKEEKKKGYSRLFPRMENSKFWIKDMPKTLLNLPNFGWMHSISSWKQKNCLKWRTFQQKNSPPSWKISTEEFKLQREQSTKTPKWTLESDQGIHQQIFQRGEKPRHHPSPGSLPAMNFSKDCSKKESQRDMEIPNPKIQSAMKIWNIWQIISPMKQQQSSALSLCKKLSSSTSSITWEEGAERTYAIALDPDDRCYIYQKVGEADKNHNENDTDEANQARIYEIPGQ